MSDEGAYPYEMERLSRLTDADLDGLLAGDVPSHGQAVELSRFIESLDDAFTSPLDEATAASHLAAITDLARAVQPHPRSTVVQPRLPSSRRAKILAACSVAVIGALGGAAYAGALPGPVQKTVSNAASTVGVDLPSDDGEVGNVENGTVGNVDDGTVGNANDAAGNNSDSGEVANTDDGAVANTDDSAMANSNDAAVANTDDSAASNTDSSAVSNSDDGTLGD